MQKTSSHATHRQKNSFSKMLFMSDLCLYLQYLCAKFLVSKEIGFKAKYCTNKSQNVPSFLPMLKCSMNLLVALELMATFFKLQSF